MEEEGEGEGDDNSNAAGNDDEAIRTYIRKQIKKFGGISTENVRKTFAIGWIRAKRLHDQEMGLKTDEVRYASDDKLRRYIRHCFDEKGSCSVNHLRQEFSVGYNRAKKILDEERERAEAGELEPEDTMPGLGGNEGASPRDVHLGKRGQAKGRGKGSSKQGSDRARQASPRTDSVAFDEAHMQGLEEDVSYLLGLGMSVNVTQRQRGRTEDESICEKALHTLLSINGNESPHTTKSGQGKSGAGDRSTMKWAKLENAREELQRQLEEAKEKRKRLREQAKDSASESRRRRASKVINTTLSTDMAKVKGKLTEIEGLRDQLDRELRRSREEREGVVSAATLDLTELRDGERMLTRKRRREASSNGRGFDASTSLSERLHKLLETTSDLERELKEQQNAIRALPRSGEVTGDDVMADIEPSVAALTSSLLSACLLSMTTPPSQSECAGDENNNDAQEEEQHTPPSSPPSSTPASPIFNRRSPTPSQQPLPSSSVTFTYPVPTLSSQEFIKSLEALTCSSPSLALGSSSSPTSASSSYASLGSSMSFTIPCAPPPSLASSLSFTALPPPLPTFTDDLMPRSTQSNAAASSPTSAASNGASIYFPPPPLPTLPVMATPFPASFPYVDYIAGSEVEKATNTNRRKEAALGAVGGDHRGAKKKERKNEEKEGEANEWRVEKGGSVEDRDENDGDRIEEAARTTNNNSSSKGKRGRGRPRAKKGEEKKKRRR